MFKKSMLLATVLTLCAPLSAMASTPVTTVVTPAPTPVPIVVPHTVTIEGVISLEKGVMVNGSAVTFVDLTNASGKLRIGSGSIADQLTQYVGRTVDIVGNYNQYTTILEFTAQSFSVKPVIVTVEGKISVVKVVAKDGSSTNIVNLITSDGNLLLASGSLTTQLVPFAGRTVDVVGSYNTTQALVVQSYTIKPIITMLEGTIGTTTLSSATGAKVTQVYINSDNGKISLAAGTVTTQLIQYAGKVVDLTGYFNLVYNSDGTVATSIVAPDFTVQSYSVVKISTIEGVISAVPVGVTNAGVKLNSYYLNTASGTTPLTGAQVTGLLPLIGEVVDVTGYFKMNTDGSTGATAPIQSFVVQSYLTAKNQATLTGTLEVLIQPIVYTATAGGATTATAGSLGVATPIIAPISSNKTVYLQTANKQLVLLTGNTTSLISASGRSVSVTGIVSPIQITPVANYGQQLNVITYKFMDMANPIVIIAPVLK